MKTSVIKNHFAYDLHSRYPVIIPSYCIVRKKGPVEGSVTMHCFPLLSKPEQRHQWLSTLNLKLHDIKNHHCACSRHFRNGDTSNSPSVNFGKKIFFPKKMLTLHGFRANKCQKLFMTPTVSTAPSPSRFAVSTPISSDVTDDDLIPECEQMTTSEGEPLISDFNIHDITSQPDISRQQVNPPIDETSVIVHKALLARIEFWRHSL